MSLRDIYREIGIKDIKNHLSDVEGSNPPNSAAATGALPTSTMEGARRKAKSRIGTGPDNIGYQLLQMQGWDGMTGLGKDRQGIVEPLKASVRLGRGGIGHDATKEIPIGNPKTAKPQQREQGGRTTAEQRRRSLSATELQDARKTQEIRLQLSDIEWEKLYDRVE